MWLDIKTRRESAAEAAAFGIYRIHLFLGLGRSQHQMAVGELATNGRLVESAHPHDTVVGKTFNSANISVQ